MYTIVIAPSTAVRCTSPRLVAAPLSLVLCYADAAGWNFQPLPVTMLLAVPYQLLQRNSCLPLRTPGPS